MPLQRDCRSDADHGVATESIAAAMCTVMDALVSPLAAVPAIPLLALTSAGEVSTTAHRPLPRPAGRARFGTRTAFAPRPDRRSPVAAPDGTKSDDSASDNVSDEADSHAEIWALVTRAQAGDGEAFGQLYDRYVDTVFRFVYYRVNDRALAEDFTSETFLRALRRIHTISYQGRDVGAWFVTIARNIVLDHMKSARHRLEVTTAELLDGDDRAPSPETAVIDRLAVQRLMQAVSELGDEQRECVMLRFMQGLSVSETAEAMGKNDGAIKALQHRAVRKLADLVGTDLS